MPTHPAALRYWTAKIQNFADMAKFFFSPPPPLPRKILTFHNQLYYSALWGLLCYILLIVSKQSLSPIGSSPILSCLSIALLHPLHKCQINIKRRPPKFRKKHLPGNLHNQLTTNRDTSRHKK